MKMGRRPRCSSVTYRFRYAPLLAPCRRPILIATKAMLFRGQDTRSYEVEPAVFRVKEVPSASTDVRKRDPLAIRRSPVGLKSNRIPARWLLRFDSLKPLGRATANDR